MRRARPWRTNRARTLRANETSAEQVLWSHLRNRQLGGLKFVRQAPIGPYFADLVCRERRFVIEVDGATHANPTEIASDLKREKQLENLGYRVVRVTNEDVYSNIDGVLEGLLAELKGGRT